MGIIWLGKRAHNDRMDKGIVWPSTLLYTNGLYIFLDL